MQEVNIASWCDLHVERDRKRVPGSEVIIGVAGEWRRIDLCTACRTELLGPIETLVISDGHLVSKHDMRDRTAKGLPKYERPPESKEKRYQNAMAPRPCLWCPLQLRNLDQLKVHMYQRHGFPTPTTGYGRGCPICRESHVRLFSHIGKKHGMKIADAFQWAIHSNDEQARKVAEARRAEGVNVAEPAAEIPRDEEVADGDEE